jgi:ABC-type multidrug transport system permease subunit
VYYLDPFKYLLGALLSFTTWNEEVVCTESEFGYFDPPNGQTCGAYMAAFLERSTGYLDNPVS